MTPPAVRIARPSTDLVATGGTVVPARNPYWDTWGVTIADPDSYRLVLCSRSWSNLLAFKSA
ncbi:hypothetical protein [Kribbella sp. NPDC048928]|uniref:hypothetical protein n=1 Tax=Kribbella sp. NPDC048928 TaxID=3364111 RepID=UPI0037241DCB